MSRQDAENLLVRDGDFLVRESTTNPGQYVLTGLQNGYPKHLLLIDPEGVVSILKKMPGNISIIVGLNFCRNQSVFSGYSASGHSKAG